MTSQEYRRQLREIERRRVLAAELAAKKAQREAVAKRERSAREAARFAIQHNLDPARIFEVQPRVQMSSGFGGLRPGPRPQDEARRARRVDEILHSLSRSKAVVPQPTEPQRIVRGGGEIVRVY